MADGEAEVAKLLITPATTVMAMAAPMPTSESRATASAAAAAVKSVTEAALVRRPETAPRN